MKKTNKKPDITKQCECCGKDFTCSFRNNTAKLKKYCSRSCAYEAGQKLQKALRLKRLAESGKTPAMFKIFRNTMGGYASEKYLKSLQNKKTPRVERKIIYRYGTFIKKLFDVEVRPGFNILIDCVTGTVFNPKNGHCYSSPFILLDVKNEK